MENTVLIIFFLIILPILLLLTVFTFIVSKFIHKDKVAHVAECVVWWLTISLIFPFRAKKHGIISRKLYGWILALLSPPAIATYYIIYSLATINSPLPYEKLDFTTREEIASITEILDFPEFEYVDNTHDGYTGVYTVHYLFKNEEEVKTLFEALSSKYDSEDNIFWTTDSLRNEYVCSRGWDGEFVKCPDNIDTGGRHVRIVIDKKGFSLTPTECWMFGADDYVNPDSLQKVIGVTLPSYTFVNCEFIDMFVDKAWEATIELENKPSIALINALQHAENWSLQDDGTFKFFMDGRNGDTWETIYVNPNSRFVRISYNTY